MLKLSDQEILDGIKSGDNRVLGHLIRIYLPKFRRFIVNNKGSSADAEDVLQEALVVIFDKLRKKELTINKEFGSYLFGICRFIWLKELNKRNKTQTVDINEDIDASDNNILFDIEKRERQKVYNDTFIQLGEDCRKLLKLFFNGMKIKQITFIMGFKSNQHTKNRKYICKKYLIEKIRSNPKFKEIKNERLDNVSEIPRW